MSEASLIFSIPGKTFLAGEYAVLKGGLALMAATEPRFELEVRPGQGEAHNIHEDSPAGKLLKSRPELFKNFSLTFVDPVGAGGFGASTAQFLAVYALAKVSNQALLDSELEIDHQELMRIYLDCAWNGEGYPPSGADLLGQERGYLTVVDKSSGMLSKFAWNFRDLDFYLVHTGMKLATHEHLRKNQPFEADKMKNSFALIQQSLDLGREGREELFVQGITEYAEALHEQGLTTDHSLELLGKIRSCPGVRAAKACGAMGADVLFIVVDKNHPPVVTDFLAQRGLRIIATEKSLGEGLRVQVNRGDLF